MFIDFQSLKLHKTLKSTFTNITIQCWKILICTMLRATAQLFVYSWIILMLEDFLYSFKLYVISISLKLIDALGDYPAINLELKIIFVSFRDIVVLTTTVNDMV